MEFTRMNIPKCNNDEVKSLCRKNERSKAATSFRMSLRRKSWIKSHDVMGSLKGEQKITSELRKNKDLDFDNCLSSYSFDKHMKMRPKYNWHNRYSTSTNNTLHKLKEFDLDDLHRKVIGRKHLFNDRYHGSSLINPPDSYLYTHHSKRKVYRGGGYCSGYVICDKYGNLVDNQCNDRNQIAAGQRNGTHHIEGGKWNPCKWPTRQKGDDFILPKIMTNDSSIVKIQNIVASERALLKATKINAGEKQKKKKTKNRE